MKSRQVASKRRQRGLAMVEAVIALPVLVLLALAAGEYGRVLMLYTTLNKAQQDGARYLANEAILGSTGAVCLGSPFSNPNPCNGSGGNVDETKNLIVFGNIDGTGTELLDGLATTDVVIIGPSDPSVLPGHVRIQVTYTQDDWQPLWEGFFDTVGISLNYPLVSTVSMRALQP